MTQSVWFCRLCFVYDAKKEANKKSWIRRFIWVFLTDYKCLRYTIIQHVYIITNFLPPSFLCAKVFSKLFFIFFQMGRKHLPIIMNITLHYERIVIKKKSTLNLTHSTYGWLLCWRNGFQKEYYILYYKAWSFCGIRLYCILLSALFNRNFIDFFIFIHFSSHPFFSFILFIIIIDVNVCELCAHICQNATVKGVRKEK